MTNYSENGASCRFEFFKASGKWYMTEAVDMTGFYNIDIGPRDGVIAAWVKRCESLGREPHDDFHIVVSEPYHKNAYPVMLVAGTYAKEFKKYRACPIIDCNGGEECKH